MTEHPSPNEHGVHHPYCWCDACAPPARDDTRLRQATAIAAISVTVMAVLAIAHLAGFLR